MSAPTDAYSDFKLKKQNSTGSISTQICPKFLSEYGTLDNFKSLFYCDLAKTIKSDSGEDIIFGFVREGTTNYSMHSRSRDKGIEVGEGSTGNLYFTPNDGGLNTYGNAVIRRVANWDNYFQAEIIFTSAYYLSSTSRIITINNITKGTLGSQSLNTTLIEESEEYTGTDNRTVRAYTTNGEGENIQVLGTYMPSGEEIKYPFAMANYYGDGTPPTTLTSAALVSSCSIHMYASQEGNLASLSTIDQNTGVYAYNSVYLDNNEFGVTDIYVAQGWYNTGYKPTASAIDKTPLLYVNAYGMITKFWDTTPASANNKIRVIIGALQDMSSVDFDKISGVINISIYRETNAPTGDVTINFTLQGKIDGIGNAAISISQTVFSITNTVGGLTQITRVGTYTISDLAPSGTKTIGITGLSTSGVGSNYIEIQEATI